MDLTLYYVVSIGLLVAGGVFLGVLLRRGGGKPRSAGQWLGVGMSIFLVLSAGLLLALTLQVNDGAYAPTGNGIGEAAPNFSFRLVDDDIERDLEAFKGQVVLLNFWATWCAPCLEEMPDLNRLQAAYGDAGLAVLTISDEPPDELKLFQGEFPMQTVYGYVETPELLPSPFNAMIDGRPVTFIIDREGVVRDFMLGARDFAFFQQTLAPYLEPTMAAR